MISKVLFSSENQSFGTPPDLFEALNDEFHFKLDAATRPTNPLNTPYFYTKEDNGLVKDWIDTTYCNPPYGREIIKWVRKAVEESRKGVTSVMLIPARTDTIWFHTYIYKNPNVEIRFLKGRLKMVNYDDLNYKFNSAPFPSMLVVFNRILRLRVF